MPQHFWMSMLSAVCFGVLGIAMIILGFKVFDWMTPIKIEEELAEKHNIAVAIVVAAVIIGVSMVIAAVIGA